MRVLLSGVSLLPVVMACGAATAPVALRLDAQVPPDAEEALSEAAEAFYGAESPEAFRAALERARELAPKSGTFSELASEWHQLMAEDIGQRLERNLQALMDAGHPAPEQSLDKLTRLSLTQSEYLRVRDALTQVAAQHPRASIRDYARYLLSQHQRGAGDSDQAALTQSKIRNGWKWTVIGAWDNDQGKGFDERLPPENTVDTNGRYEGMTREIGWRVPRLAPVGPELDFGAIMTPNKWAVAYALTEFEVEGEDPLELRLMTSSPIKIWIDDQEIFSARVVQEANFDQFVIPLNLSPGHHRLLLKSAQETRHWRVSARITEVEGGISSRIRPAVPGCCGEVAPASRIDSISTTPNRIFASMIQKMQKQLGTGLRTQVYALRLANRMGLRAEALAVSDRLLKSAPKSIYARYVRARTAWRHSERGKTSDLLAELSENYGDELVFFHFQYARFLRQEGLNRKARSVLTRAGKHASNPAIPALNRRWAQQFKEQQWIEDECQSLEKALQYRPKWIDVQLNLARCYETLRFFGKARVVYSDILNQVPNYRSAIDGLFRYEFRRDAFRLAIGYAQKLVVLSPQRAEPLLRLAEISRRQQRWSEAGRYLTRAQRLNPDSAKSWRLRAEVAYQSGNKDSAVRAWREALNRDPNNDALSYRLAWLDPQKEGPWIKDVPDEDMIKQTLAQTGGEPSPGAHTLSVLDHEVTLVKPDGSSSDFVTMVAKALDDTGRDQLTSISLRRGGRLRVLQAYAISPSGERSQASNIRARVARFRNLAVGSTVVLQYRHDAPPIGYLSRHIARAWWFQQPGSHVTRSQWVLWLPKGQVLHEWSYDPQSQVQREETEIADHRRISWLTQEVPAMVPEPGMPTQQEVSLNLHVSTVPDWATFLEWEKALLTDAFRQTSDMTRLAQEIVEGAETPKEKALRIHKWLMEEIRYQQDYENSIAGVRPHAAPVVVERRYGDCKDKSVLFVTLARQVGLKAEFALLRTRPRGPLLRDIPMQQFDHAIVYVPKQPGLEEGFFVDSTADALDLSALRHDDTGVQALVFDTESRVHQWKDIAFRPATENSQTLVTRLDIDRSGAAVGQIDFSAQGMTGSSLRRLARNQEGLKQAMQGVVARMYGGAVAKSVQVVEAEDLEKPASVQLDVSVGVFAREEDNTWRVKLPPIWNPKNVFQLEDRKYPILLGVPQSMLWETEVHLPSGGKLRRSPPPVVIDAPCFRFERNSEVKAGYFTVRQAFETRCERVSVGYYSEHRKYAEQMLKTLDEEWVFVE